MEIIGDQYDVVYMLNAVGAGRAGKSTLLCAGIGFCAANNLVANVTVDECETYVCNAFVAGRSTDPVTHGIDVAVGPLRSGGPHNIPPRACLLIFDCEGLRNADTKGLDLLLALSTQLGRHLIFVELMLNDVTKEDLNRLVLSKMLHIQSRSEEDDTLMPFLHMVVNKNDFDVREDSADRMFDLNGDESSQVIMETLLLLVSRNGLCMFPCICIYVCLYVIGKCFSGRELCMCLLS